MNVGGADEEPHTMSSPHNRREFVDCGARRADGVKPAAPCVQMAHSLWLLVRLE